MPGTVPKPFRRAAGCTARLSDRRMFYTILGPQGLTRRWGVQEVIWPWCMLGLGAVGTILKAKAVRAGLVTEQARNLGPGGPVWILGPWCWPGPGVSQELGAVRAVLVLGVGGPHGLLESLASQELTWAMGATGTRTARSLS